MIADRRIIHRTECCGIRMLYGIATKTPEEVLYSVSVHGHEDADDRIVGAHFIFADNTGRDDGYGNALKQLIEDNNLGEVHQTQFTHNPNSGNQLRSYMWTPDYDALHQWRADIETAETEEVLEETGLEIGDFVRCGDNTPNRFNGRATLDRIENGHLRFTLKDGTRHSMLLDEARVLVKTRPFVRQEAEVLPF